MKVASSSRRVGETVQGNEQGFETVRTMRGKGSPFTRTALGALLGLAACIAASQDASTTLLLRCNNSMNGAQGEVPLQVTGVSYEAGVQGNGAFFSPSNIVRFARAGNIDSREGTLSFWIKPRWSGNDGLTYSFASLGSGGGMVFAKDGANNLRSIFNRFGVGAPEQDVAINVSTWTANQWHFVAYTWSNTAGRLRLFIDGTLVAQRVLSHPLNAVTASDLYIGSDAGSSRAFAVLDEIEVSDRARTDSEIFQRFLSGLNITAIDVTVPSTQVFPTWRKWPTVQAMTNLGPMTIPATALTWQSSASSVAAFDPRGFVLAYAPGVAQVTATAPGGASDSVVMNVATPVLPMSGGSWDPYLQQLPGAYNYEMPVLCIRYLPTFDGINIHAPTADFNGTIAQLETNIKRFEVETKFMLQEGSRFRGYSNVTPYPALGYRIVGVINIYEPMPPDDKPGHELGGGAYFPDYNAILERIGARHYIENLGVKEVWLWGYHHGNIVPVESNMSSPLTGDISNSLRWNDDLPVYDRTYVLYNYNFTRSSNESVHNHGHQLEAILGHVAWIQDGNDRLFWRDFVGQNASGQFITGRCGWTHMPPNTTSHYDYWNSTPVASTIEDWRPDHTGSTTTVNAQRWGTIPYAWPYGRIPEDVIQHQWYIYWMQNMPGAGNTIPKSAGYMTDWWCFTGDWDLAYARVAADFGLHSTTRTIRLGWDRGGSSAQVRIRSNASGQVVVNQVVSKGPNGLAEIAMPAGMGAGLYELSVKPRKALRRTLANRSVSASGFGPYRVAVVLGDIDNDNEVSIGDYALLSYAFGSEPGDPNWIEDADLNGDLEVDILDFAILSGAWGQIGDP